MLHQLRQRLRQWIRPDRPIDFRERIASFALGAGDLAIDCGANVGSVTELLAQGGATVYAFEPHPHAFAQLSQRFADRPHIHCFNQAVLDRPDRLRLYFHRRASEDEIYFSRSTSMFAGKSNVNPESFVDVEAIDLAGFITRLGRPVRVVKMDIEGAECRVVNRLIDSGAIRQIEHLVVEVHDLRIPELRTETNALRKRIAREGLRQIRLDWI